MSTKREPDAGGSIRTGLLARGRLGFASACLLAVVACAPSADVATSRDTRAGRDERSSRGALIDRAEEGKVRTVVHGNPFGMDVQRRDALVTRAMAAGVSGLRPEFTVYPDEIGAAEPHLVVVLNPVASPIELGCRDPESIPTASADATGEMEILAVFCDGEEPIGSARTQGPVSGPTDRRLERLLWRTSAELFPDDYWETYGFGFLPKSFDLGIGGSIGID